MPFFGVPIRNGLPIGLGSVAGFGVQQFDPSQLFAGGTVAGAWYDPSDLSTMFDTSAGTTPVAMPGLGAAVPVGLMLDKSQGLVLGSELVTNGDFSQGSTGWTDASTSPATFTVSGGQGVLTQTDANKARARQTITVNANSWNKFVYDTSGIITIAFGATLGGNEIFSLGGATSTLGSGVRYFYSTVSTVYISIVRESASAGISSFDNISVRELPGNHAIAFNNTTARPELRARVNLLEYSEQFDNAYWAKAGSSTIAANSDIAPDGTLTADTLTLGALVFPLLRVDATTLALSAASYTQRCAFKRGNTDWVVFYLSDAGVNYAAVWLNTSTGQLGTVTAAGTFSGASAVVTPQNNGFWLVQLTFTKPSTAATHACSIIPVSGGDGSFTRTAGDTVIIWGADLRPANIGANVPAYQRIADANTYDTSGFPLYLRFDGIDDSMYTPANLNLSGTDKVSVFAGVRKLDNTNALQLVELSTAVGSNVGAFSMPTNDIGAGRWATYLSGSTGIVSASAAGTTAPITTVNTSLYDIALSADEARLRINGTQVATSGASSAGTGNFGTYPLYIGSRANSGLWFNGHLYSLVVAGSAVSAGNISATEQWVAGKTGIQI